MEFKPRRYDTHNDHNQSYYMPFSSSSSTYIYFSDQAMKVGLATGTRIGVSLAGLEVLRRPVDSREIIRRELYKENLRLEIIAQEIERNKRILEEEVWRELRIDREMMHYGREFPPAFIPRPSHSHRLLQIRSFSPENRRIEMPLKEMNGDNHRDFRGFEVAPFRRSPKIQEITTSSPKEEKGVFIGLGVPHDSKRKPPLSEIHSSHLQKKRKDDFRCAICKISVTSKQGFNEHLSGKKHQSKMASLRPQDTSGSTGVERIKKGSSVNVKKSTRCVKFQRKNMKRTRK